MGFYDSLLDHPRRAFRTIFGLYGMLSLVFFVISLHFAVTGDYELTTLNWIYPIFFGAGVASCIAYDMRPIFGKAVVYLIPISFATCIRTIDLFVTFLMKGGLDQPFVVLETRMLVSTAYMFVAVSPIIVEFFDRLVCLYYKVDDVSQLKETP